MSNFNLVDVKRNVLESGEVVDTVITSEGFLNWKHHFETCITKKTSQI